MSEKSLTQLEYEVEAARAKLATGLATLGAPRTLDQLRYAMRNDASQMKDRWIGAAREGVGDQLRDWMSVAKQKAAANPGAVAAIGAGLAWRLMRHPPVATALVGAGLYSLLATDRNERSFAERHRLEERAESVVAKAHDLRDAATEMLSTSTEKIQDWASQISETGGEVADAIKERVSRAADQGATTAHQALDSGQRLAESAAESLSAARRKLADEDAQDRILLGAAGLAVAAALGFALRRNKEYQGYKEY